MKKSELLFDKCIRIQGKIDQYETLVKILLDDISKDRDVLVRHYAKLTPQQKIEFGKISGWIENDVFC